MDGSVDKLELRIARAEADGKKVKKAPDQGVGSVGQFCMYCGDETTRHDVILRKRIARALGKPTSRIVMIWACTRCLNDLGYAKGESIDSRREFLIRKYERAAYDRKHDEKEQARLERERLARGGKKRGDLKAGYGKIRKRWS